MWWKISERTGFANYGRDLTAYIDFEPTSSGAVRLLGPFDGPDSRYSAVQVCNQMQRLTNLIEASYISDSQYVVWGSYQEEPDYVEHSFPIQGTTCGFRPAIWLRSLSFPQGVKREWYEFGHRCGLSTSEKKNAPDMRLFHPNSAELAQSVLTKQSERWLGRQLVTFDFSRSMWVENDATSLSA